MASFWLSVDPASAQYAGTGRGFLVTPLRVPAGSDLSGVGFGCTAGVTVTITIQGEPGIFTTVVAEDDSTYSFDGVPIPSSLTIGDTYTAVASCDGVFETAEFTVICANGDEPDADGNCPIPSASTSVPGSSSTGSPTTTIATNEGSTSDPLAFTGANTFEIVRLAATLMGMGALLVLLGRRHRRDQDAAGAH